jgi:hypothetical protein
MIDSRGIDHAPDFLSGRMFFTPTGIRSARKSSDDA